MRAADELETCFEFGRFRALARRRQLLLDGAPIELGTRAFDVLLALLEAGGALVTKDELMARVWPGTVVEENNIQVQISALRRALGGDRKAILTVPLRGYRFTAEIRVTAAGDAPVLAPLGAAAAAPSRSNLPAPVSEFVGREQELDEVADLVVGHRLVTLIGGGGIGKTRLGVEVARRALPALADGVWLAELAPLADPALVPTVINAALGLQTGAGPLPPDRLALSLRGKALLLVIDNCEHVIAAAAHHAETLLQVAPGLRILATSQEPLSIDGECLYRLRPLEVPDEGISDPAAALRHDAVRLFVARARAADPHFQLDERSVPVVGGICRRLDGIPLAIELAAARAATLGVEGLAQRLDDRFHVLIGGRRTALPRYQTLRATLDWSHGLLTETERIVLRRLGVFAGGFTLDAAAAVIGDDGLPGWEVVDSVAELVAKSLVVADAGSAPRYRLLETTRIYALERLAEAGEVPVLAPRHASYYRHLLERALAAWAQTPSVQWLAENAPEIDNFRTALDWAFGGGGDRVLGLELTAASGILWYLLSLMAEGRSRFECAIAALDPDTPKSVEAGLWFGYGFLVTGQPRGRALPALERAVTLYRGVEDKLSLGRALEVYGLSLSRDGRVAEGEGALAEARDLLAGEGDRKSYARCLTDLAVARLIAGRFDEARSLIGEALSIGRASGADYWVLRMLVYSAEIDFATGQVARAIAQGQEVVAMCRAMRRIGLRGHALCNLASYWLARGELDQAREALREGLPLAREGELGSALVAIGLQHLAMIALGDGAAERAAMRLGYADAFFTAQFEGRNPKERRVRDTLLAQLRSALPPERLDDLMGVGARWTEEEAMADALAG